jgi:hypothetical protein
VGVALGAKVIVGVTRVISGKGDAAAVGSTSTTVARTHPVAASNSVTAENNSVHLALHMVRTSFRCQ